MFSLLLVLAAVPASAQHVSVWTGGGIGSFLYQPRQLVVLFNAALGAHF